MGSLQKEMARTTAVLVRQVLRVWWCEESGPVVSEDERLKEEDLHWFQYWQRNMQLSRTSTFLLACCCVFGPL